MMVIVQREALNQFESNVLAGTKQNAQISADGVFNGLNMLMTNGIIGDPEQRALFVKKMGAAENVNELRVIRNQSVQKQFGPGLPSEQAQDELDRMALGTGKVQIRQLENIGRHELRVVVPFIAKTEYRGTNCLSCHSEPEGTVSGAASITMDITKEYDLMRTANYWLWSFQILIQIILYFLIGSWIHKVLKPLDQSLEIANRIATGDLSTQIMADNDDEIGRLLKAMQTMQNNIRAIVTEIKNIVEAAASRGDFSVKMDMNGKAGYTKELSELLNQLSNITGTAMDDVTRVATALAAGDLSQKITKDYPGVFGQTKNGVNSTVDSLTKIVTEIQGIVEAANKGDFGIKLDMNGKLGYTKTLSELLNQLSDTVDTAFNDTIHIAQALSKGDLTQTVTRDYQGAFNDVKQSLNTTVDNLKNLVNEVKVSVDSIGTASKEIATGNTDLSQRTEEQASSLEKTAASMEELTSTVKQNSDNATQALSHRKAVQSCTKSSAP